MLTAAIVDKRKEVAFTRGHNLNVRHLCRVMHQNCSLMQTNHACAEGALRSIG